MKDYYAILGVRREADAAAIKRAYRKLVIQYHPDKNPSPEAESLIKEINEAYDVLSDPARKSSYDLRLANPFTGYVQEESKPRHRDPAYKRKGPNTKYKSEKERIIELMSQYLPWTNRFIYAAFFVSVIFVIDFTLPVNKVAAIIIQKAFKRTPSRGGSNVSAVLYTSKGTVVQLPFQYTDHFSQGDAVKISISPILKVPRQIQGKSVSVEIKKSIYGSFLFAPIALLLTSCFGLYFRQRIDYAFNSGVVSFLLLLLTAIIFLMLR